MHVKTSAFYIHWQTLLYSSPVKGSGEQREQHPSSTGRGNFGMTAQLWSCFHLKQPHTMQDTWARWKSKGTKKHKCDSQFNWDALSGSQGREVPAQLLQVPVQHRLPAVGGTQLQHYKSCHSCVQRPLVRDAPSTGTALCTVNGCSRWQYLTGSSWPWPLHCWHISILVEDWNCCHTFRGWENCLIKMALLHESLL